MKQIFDWLREQLEQGSVACGGIKLIDVHKVRTLINKAEAEWEADCCEWKRLAIGNSVWKTSCGKQRTIILNRDENFCPYCGKPIKISEVE